MSCLEEGDLDIFKTLELKELPVCRLWDLMGKNIKPAPVQVQFLEIDSLPVVYIKLNILVGLPFLIQHF